MTARTKPEAGEPTPTIKCSLEAPGYSSTVSFPVSADAREAFCGWFEMQLAYLSRWKPGSTAVTRETTPL